jgi:hypothetical protein
MVFTNWVSIISRLRDAENASAQGETTQATGAEFANLTPSSGKKTSHASSSGKSSKSASAKSSYSSPHMRVIEVSNKRERTKENGVFIIRPMEEPAPTPSASTTPAPAPNVQIAPAQAPNVTPAVASAVNVTPAAASAVNVAPAAAKEPAVAGIGPFVPPPAVPETPSVIPASMAMAEAMPAAIAQDAKLTQTGGASNASSSQPSHHGSGPRFIFDN